MSKKVSFFNRFADKASTFVAKPQFFAFTVIVILVWLPSYFLIGTVEIWQLIINTFTTCVTFMLVALLQNDQDRFEQATNEKLNAMAEGLAAILKDRGLDSEAEALYGVEGREKEVEP